MSTILFQVTLPSLAAPDVVSRSLTMTVDGGDSQNVPVAVDTLTVDLEAPQDANVTLSLVDIDDADNESPPSIKTFVALDTFPPPQPGEMDVVVTGEVA